jgi:hypothetical protein
MPVSTIDQATRRQERLGRALARRFILAAFLRGEISTQELERARCPAWRASPRGPPEEPRPRGEAENRSCGPYPIT